MKNKKILVFGSSGFLGAHLIESLFKENQVIQFDTNPPNTKYDGTTFVQGSILDKKVHWLLTNSADHYKLVPKVLEATCLSLGIGKLFTSSLFSTKKISFED